MILDSNLILSQCKACGLTQETRTAHCASKSGKIYNDTFCANRQMPELSRPCNQSVECDYQWFSSQWSKCSVDCGQGVQTRNIVCGKMDKNGVKPAEDESKCDAAEKPEKEKECDTGKKCEGQWFTGPWSDCDKKCGGGKRTRKVLCIGDGNAVAPAKCGEDKIEFSSEDCNKEPCVEDELIPIDTTANPIEEDDEGEEYCDEEDEDYTTIEVDSESDSSSSPFDSTTEFESSSVSSESSASSLFTDEDLMQSDSTFSTDASDGTTLYCKQFENFVKHFLL